MAATASILMGSDSDWETMKACSELLKEFGVAHDVKVHSAHRTPDEVHAYVKKADKDGTQLFICAAGLAAHLAGVVASLTTKPVIGCPMSSPDLGGLDALLSTVQMPGGVPVATVGIGKHGAKNAALLAVAILALNNSELAKKLKDYREQQRQAILKKNDALKF